MIKLDDYHAIIRNILDEFRRLQDEGFILNVPVLPNEANSELGSSFWGYCRDNNIITISIHFIPVLQLVISDCKGANYLAGRYEGHTKVKFLVRDCDILSIDADFENYICCYHIHKKMAHLLEEQPNKLSFHKITHNGFYGIVMGANAKYRQFGMSPPEILHLLWIGLCDYLWQGFYKKLSGDLRKRLYIFHIYGNTFITKEV